MKVLTAVVIAVVITAIVSGLVTYAVVPTKEVVKEVPKEVIVEKPVTPQRVKIELWEAWAGEPAEAALKEIAASFSKLNPYIEVVVTGYTGSEYWTKLRSAMAAGEPPDMYVTYGGGELFSYVEEGQSVEITDLLREDWAKKIYTEDELAVAKLGDKLYGMPFEANMIWMFVNVDLFKKAGVSVPENGWSWDEFISAVKKLKAAGITPLGIGAKDKWDLGWYWVTLVDRIGGKDAYYKALNREISFTDTVFVEAYRKIRELLDLNPCQSGWETAGAFDVWGMFGKGDIAMYVGGSWAAGFFDTFAGLNYAIVPFPYVVGGKGDPKATHILPNAISVSPTGAKHKEQVYQFLRFLASTPIQVYFAHTGKSPMAANIAMPSGTYGVAMEKAIKWTRESPYFILPYGTMSPPELGTLLSNTHAEVMLGKKTPEDACKGFEDLAKDLQSRGVLPYKK